MNNFTPLVKNEVVKIWKKKRFYVVLTILLILIPVFVYAQLQTVLAEQERVGTQDWRVSEQQKVNEIRERLNSPRIRDEWKDSMRIQLQLSEYYLEKNVNPQEPNAVTFSREFFGNSFMITLFLPLLITLIASDMVSSEHAGGTIKLLLTRPVRRWRILSAKYAAMFIYVSLIVFTVFVLTYLISGLVFGYGGWRDPVFTGFQITGGAVDIGSVQVVEHWQFILIELGLAWISALVVGCLAVMLSVLIRSTAASMGTMLATLIAGLIMSNMVASWESAKYFFMVNLELIGYVRGVSPPVSGMTLDFSLINLAVWAVASIAISYRVFTRRDIY